MGLLTWIIVAVVILAIIGLGWQVFFSGVARGADKILGNPAVGKASDETKEFAANVTNDLGSGIAKQFSSK